MLIYAHPLVKVIRAREFLQGVGKDPWFILIQSGEEQVPMECDGDGVMWQLLMGICNKFPPGIAESNLDAFCYPAAINLADFEEEWRCSP